jgi:hypothetical protein
MYRPCYLNTENNLIAKLRDVKNGRIHLDSFDGLVYFKTEIEALICCELLKIQRSLWEQHSDCQMVIKKRAIFEYLEAHSVYSGQGYRFAFTLEFYHIADIWKRITRNNPEFNPADDSPWDERCKKIFFETLNDIAAKKLFERNVVSKIYIDYMKDTPNDRIEQSLCFHVSLLNAELSKKLTKNCLVVIDKQLHWYDVPFRTTDLLGLRNQVTDIVAISVLSSEEFGSLGF